MTAAAEITGVVHGEILLTVEGDVAAISFVLADEQQVLSPSGTVVRAELAWCQVICRSETSQLVASTLLAGDEVTVRGVLQVLRPSFDSTQCDVVLVSLDATSIEARLQRSRGAVPADRYESSLESLDSAQHDDV